MFLCVTVAHAQTIIDFDYVKTFSISNLWIDYNQNEEVEVEEVFMADEFVQCDLYLKYKDFESAGNYLYFTLNIENKKKNKKHTFKSTLEDVIFAKEDSVYMIGNKIKEKLAMIIIDKDRNILAIYNPSILE